MGVFDIWLQMFQSTHPRGVRPEHEAVQSVKQCFNPRTRVGCDVSAIISHLSVDKFQSTHPRGVRLRIPYRPYRKRCRFNPRTRVGCDEVDDGDGELQRVFQCTRVGCDQFRLCTFLAVFAFQSTHPRGVRLRFAHKPCKSPLFQSTHPRGVRLVAISQSPAWRSFNPRTRVGCDVKTP